MIKYIKLFLVLIIGIFSGIIIHGIIEILSILVLLSWLKNLFFRLPWSTWSWLDLTFFVVVEILTVVAVLLIYRKYEK